MQGTDVTLRPARFWPRAAAYLVDRIILAVLLLGPRIAVAIRSIGSDSLSRAVLFRFSWGDIFLWLAAVLYFVAFTFFLGATPGKLAMGLRVTDRAGGRPTFLTVLCRETYARYLSGILLIGYILAAADPVNGALHDRICDTMVVPADDAPKPVKPAPERPVREVADPAAQWYEPYRK